MDALVSLDHWLTSGWLWIQGGPESTAGVAVLERYLPAEPKEAEAEWGDEDAFDNEQVAYREGIMGPLCKGTIRCSANIIGQLILAVLCSLLLVLALCRV